MHLWEQWLDSCLQLLPNSLQATNRVYQVTLFFHINVIIQKITRLKLVSARSPNYAIPLHKTFEENYSCTVTVNMALYSLLHMEQNKRFELSLPVWKTGVLTINTNSANWSWRKDLNLQLIAYKAITLPLESRQRIKKVFQQNLRQQKTEVFQKVLRL